jgi:hypothetical protein
MSRCAHQMESPASCRGLRLSSQSHVLTRQQDDTGLLSGLGFHARPCFLGPAAHHGLSFSASSSSGNRLGNSPSEHLSPAFGIPRASKHLRPWPSSPAGPALRVSGRFDAFAFSRATKGRDGRGLNPRKETIQ